MSYTLSWNPPVPLVSGQCWIAQHGTYDPRVYLIVTSHPSFDFVAVRLLEDGATVDIEKSAEEVFADLATDGWSLHEGSIQIEVSG